MMRFLVVCLFLSACSPEPEVADSDLFSTPFSGNTRILGHKGSGTHGEYGNSSFPDNSLAGVINAVRHTDGAEVDIQLSSDSTLRLFHDHEAVTCSGDTVNFFLLSNEQLREMRECNTAEYASLSALFKELEDEDFEGKYLSLDLKVLQNPEVINHFGGKEKAARAVAEQLKAVMPDPRLKMMIEVPYPEQVPVFDNIDAKTCLLCAVDEQTCTRKAFELQTGISVSHRFVRDHPQVLKNARAADVSVQLWVPNTPEELIKAMELNPDFIQTDHLSCALFLKQIHRSGSEREEVSTTQMKKLTGEFHSVFEINTADLREDALLSVSFEAPEQPGTSELKVVVTANHGDRSNPLFWRAHNVKAGQNTFLEFIDADFLKDSGSEMFKIYFWNPDAQQTAVQNIEVVRITPS